MCPIVSETRNFDMKSSGLCFVWLCAAKEDTLITKEAVTLISREASVDSLSER